MHRLDERLQEAEKVGDPHQFAQTITSQLILVPDFLEGLDWDFEGLGRSGEVAGRKKWGILKETRTV